MARRLLTLTAVLAAGAAAVAGAVAPAARAGFVPAAAIDAPAAGTSIGDADLARDGDGAVAYLRDAHVVVVRLVDGVPQQPERVDLAAAGPVSSRPAVGVADGGRVVVTFLNGDGAGPEALYAALRPAGGAFGPAAAIGGGEEALSADTDMGADGTAVTAFAVRAGAQADIHAARLDGSTWTAVPDPLDVDVTRAAGAAAGQAPRVGVDGAGAAVVAWGEDAGPGDPPEVWMRRVTGTTAAAPLAVGVSAYAGADRPATGPADQPDVAVDDAGGATLAFREIFSSAGVDHARALVRRLSGAALGDPVAVDGLGTAPGDDASAPRVDLSARGTGVATAARDAGLESTGALLTATGWADLGVLSPGPATAAPGPVAAAAGNGAGLVAWRQGGRVLSRQAGFGFGPATELSWPALGAAQDAGLEAGADGAGDALIAFVQGAGVARRPAVALLDAPPGAPRGATSERFARERRPRLTWRGASDAWGAVAYRVVVDGSTAGTTGTKVLTLTAPLSDGRHVWRVLARDSRGQETPSRSRALLVDTRRPRISLRISGKRRVRRKLRFYVKARDGAGSGVKAYKMTFTKSKSVKASKASKRFTRPGRVRVTVRVRDRVGNVSQLVRMITIRR